MQRAGEDPLPPVPIPAVAEQTGPDELTVTFDAPRAALPPQARPPSSTRATSSSAAAPSHGPL
ncbi:MAG: hypothetical protein ACLTDR_16820 [Adlercreutzia equolifaciens]